MRIRFVAEPGPHSGSQGVYDVGKEYDLPEDQVHRWVRRGVAVLVDPPKPPERPVGRGAPPSVGASTTVVTDEARVATARTGEAQLAQVAVEQRSKAEQKIADEQKVFAGAADKPDPKPAATTQRPPPPSPAAALTTGQPARPADKPGP